MLKFIQQLIDLNSALVAKARSTTIYDEALALHEAKEYAKAFPLMQEAAGLGSLPAMSLLGSMYLLGRGTREDGVKAHQSRKSCGPPCGLRSTQRSIAAQSMSAHRTPAHRPDRLAAK